MVLRVLDGQCFVPDAWYCTNVLGLQIDLHNTVMALHRSHPHLTPPDTLALFLASGQICLAWTLWNTIFIFSYSFWLPVHGPAALPCFVSLLTLFPCYFNPPTLGNSSNYDWSLWLYTGYRPLWWGPLNRICFGSGCKDLLHIKWW